MSLNSEKIFAGVEHADARSLLYATGHLQENIGRYEAMYGAISLGGAPEQKGTFNLGDFQPNGTKS